jgi:hypothetical protein
VEISQTFRCQTQVQNRFTHHSVIEIQSNVDRSTFYLNIDWFVGLDCLWMLCRWMKSLILIMISNALGVLLPRHWWSLGIVKSNVVRLCRHRALVWCDDRHVNLEAISYDKQTLTITVTRRSHITLREIRNKNKRVVNTRGSSITIRQHCLLPGKCNQTWDWAVW